MIAFNHGQRDMIERLWKLERAEWLERQCQLALDAGPSPLKETREARHALKRETAKLSAKIQAAIDQLDKLEDGAGLASDVLASCRGRGGDVGRSLADARAFAWELENELERLGADKKPRARTTLLIRLIADRMREDGIVPNELESGPFYRIAGLALEAIGVEPRDLRGTIRQALAETGEG